MTRTLIITADDFGISREVNEAVEIAHRDGVLNTTSLMMGERAVPDAVARAKRLPGLKVGLHVVVSRARPVLPPERIPTLVGADGLLRGDLFTVGLRYFFSPRARRELAAEIRAQFQAFRDTGLPLDHANVHNHLQLHPTILGMVISIGREFGLRAVRIPMEPVLSSRKAAGESWAAQLPKLALSGWARCLRLRARLSGMFCNDYLYGISRTGNVDREYVLNVLKLMPAGVTELHLHPATAHWDGMEAAAAHYSNEAELHALIDPMTRAAIAAADIRIASFSELAR